MKSQGIFSQQSEGSPHLLQLNALICLLWRQKVLGLVRQENKCYNFHQQSGCSDRVLTHSLQIQWKNYIHTAFLVVVFLWDLCYPACPRLCTALSLRATETWGCCWLQLRESLTNFIFPRFCQCNAFFILRNDLSVYIEVPSHAIAGVSSTVFMLQIKGHHQTTFPALISLCCTLNMGIFISQYKTPSLLYSEEGFSLLLHTTKFCEWQREILINSIDRKYCTTTLFSDHRNYSGTTIKVKIFKTSWSISCVITKEICCFLFKQASV